MFALVDCNNFYVSCERTFRPDLNNKPVVVLSNNDGCVISRSDEAKALGIPMGAPAFKYKEILEQNNVSVFSSNYVLYGDMSVRIMNLLSSFAPEIEIYSIDEAFLEFKDFKNYDFEKYGSQIKSTIIKSTGIPVSIGFAETKALSKIANKIAKKFSHKTKGVYCIDTHEKRIKALKWLEVGKIWGIGRQYAKLLRSYGINTAFDLTQQSDHWVLHNLSVVGLKLKYDLEGKPTIELERPEARKNIATTRSFEKNYTSFEELCERVSTFAVACAQKLRAQNSNCNAVLVFIHTNSHRHDLKQYSRSTTIKLPYPTNSDLEISNFAIKALSTIYEKGYEYKKAGVIVMDITLVSEVQINLFQNSDTRHESLMNAVDKINKTIGKPKVKLGIQDLTRTWKMRQEKLSPRYTTQLQEIIKVKV